MRLPYVHEMFAQMARQYPTAIAVETEQDCLIYAELKDKSDRIAAAVLAAGTKANELVVIYGEDRTFFIECMIGVLSAGAAFVPLSSSIPAKRLGQMIEECAPRWAIVQPGMSEKFAALDAGRRMQIISVPDNALSAEFISDSELDPDGLAYVFFTSGSTGKPKGIAGRLKAIDHFIRWEMETFALGPGSRISQLMAPTFDAFMRDVFAPLSSGGTVCVPAEDAVLDGKRLGKWIDERKITLVHTVPSVFRLMLNQNGHAGWKSVKHLLLSGEALLPADVKRWYEMCGPDGGQIVNLYGPTETTMTKFAYMVSEADQEKRSVPIGKPMRGAKAIVLDQNGKICPPWRIGELYIRTPFRSLGYYGHPELTKQVFVPNPFGREAGDVVYKTGDLVRITDTGDFELIGRKDNQVKVRGVRIELDELESVLSECAEVAQCAVAVLDDDAGDKRLAAYVVPRTGAEVTPGDLRRFLAERLPESMLPSCWSILTELPLTATGKVDRQLLKQLQMTASHEGAGLEARTQTEEILCGIWAEVLKAPAVHVNDNFFEMGGHSLLATQLISRITPALSVELHLRTVFEAPTVAKMAAHIVKAKQEQQQVELPPIQQVPRGDALPLSFAQLRLWFIDQLEANDTTYNMPWAVRIHGPFDSGVLESSLQEVVQRQESLRTHFTMREGEPRQIIKAELHVPLPTVDLTFLSPGERLAEAQRIIQRDFEQPFELTTVPLFRPKLIRLDGQDHVLSLIMHHIVSDGWSIALFVRELLLVYKARRAGHAASLPELSVQYADFALWQRDMLERGVLQQQLGYWRGQLDGMETLQLSTDRPRTALARHRGGLVKFAFTAEDSARLRAIARQQGVTVFMFLLGAMEILLWRYSGQTDLVIGTDAANRQRAETENVIGFFVNELVLRLRIEKDLTRNDLLKLVREMVLAAYEHQDLPFQRLVQELQPERDLTRSPLFQVVVLWQSLFKNEPALPGLRFERFENPQRFAKTDLNLMLEDGAEGVTGKIEYSADLFEQSTVERMARHLQLLALNLVAQPDKRLSEFALLDEAERREVLAHSRQTRGEYAQDRYVHELFAECARLRPHACAVRCGEGWMSYGELNARANQVASRLHQRGARPDTLVGLCVVRSLEMLVGVLGILKAGAAYVPLDPAYPKERLDYLIQNSAVRVILGHRQTADLLAESTASVLLLDNIAEWEGAAESPRIAVWAEQLAYVIYTSGSTGRPKGVAVSHGNLLHSTHARSLAYPETVDKFLLLPSFAFDSSVAGLFWTLAQGGELHVPEEGKQADVDALGELMEREGITHLLALPSLYAALLESGPAASTKSLRRVIVAGESCTSDLTARHDAMVPQAALANEYGPTEATVWSTVHFHEHGGTGVVPIGRPIANTGTYVLNEELELVPVGVPGELYIAGDGVARGYLKRPELTAGRFLPNPFEESRGERLYRTGDRVRYRAGGELEFLGRFDEQIKLRGYRIELGEIEEILRAHPGVQEAAVSVRGVPGQESLVGYFAACRDSAETSVTSLETWLRQKLPRYMVPGALVQVEQLPRTPNGKVDRKALPQPERQASNDPSGEQHSVEEQILCGIFEELLGHSGVGTQSNFFDLGGHSLLATQAISRIRNTFQVDLPLRVLFERPTVAGLAEGIRAARATSLKPAPVLKRIKREGDLPLSFAQQRLWFLDQLQPGNIAHNAPFAVRLTGVLDTDALEYSINQIVSRHEILRTSFPARAGKPLQEIAPELKLHIKQTDLGRIAEAAREPEAERLLRTDAERPFDLGRTPLVRVHLLRLKEDDHILFVNMHHIVSDAWSIGIVVREFVELYRARIEGRESRLAELQVQYADFSVWQRQWLHGEVLEEQLGYWRNQLAAIETLQLPADRPRPAVLSSAGAVEAFRISGEIARQLSQISRRENVTVFMTLLAALQLILSKYTGQQDIAVGTAVANRNRAEMEGLIGFFVNTLVMRTNLRGAWSFKQLLNHVRHIALDAYQHQDLPFEKLVEDLHPERDLSHSPLFQVFLVLQNTRAEQLEIPGLRLAAFPAGTTAAKFELMFTLTEAENEISGELSYMRELYTQRTIQRLLMHFQLVLEQLANDPEKRIGDVSLLAQSERRQILHEWNDTSVELPPAFVHELIREQAARTPNAVAVRDATGELSYRGLDEAANAIACALKRRKIGPEMLVGICLERSATMVAAILGVLQSGAAYVPLDPHYPAERLAYMIDDSRAALVVTSSGGAAKLIGTNANILNVEGLNESVQSEDPMALYPQNIAYVIYTSGSTGKPKGTAVTHANLYNHMMWMQRAHPLEAADSVLQKTPFSFDASIWEFYAPLLAGGVLVMAEPDAHHNPQYMVDCIRTEAITVLQLVPSQLRMLLDQPGMEQCYSLRRVYCGGELLSPGLVRSFYERLPWATLYNLYGPTEATVDATYAECGANLEGESAPIGKPIANLRVYVLDPEQQPVPAGLAGELYISGAGVARGYLRQPRLTAEKFIPDPFSGLAGARFYRTGDRVRWLPDGRLEFLGRLDQQVKIRGHRVELGEIEAVLRSCPGVEQAVAHWQDERLAAYVVMARGTSVNSRDLRKYLQDQMPEYAIPGAFVEIEQLPLTPNGKLDRSALPRPIFSSSAEDGYVAPRSQEENALCSIWSKLLNVDRVGIHDNFFELGGDSILAIQVISQAREKGLRFTVRQLFEKQTVAELADVVERQAGSDGEHDGGAGFPLTPVRREDLKEWIGDGEGIEDIYPLSAMQLGLLFHSLYESSEVYFVQLACHMQNGVEPHAFRRAWREVVNRHAILRTAFLWEGADPPVQAVWEHVDLPWREEDWRELSPAQQEERWESFLREEREQGFDFQQPCLMRLALMRTDEHGYYFAWSTHHILLDGWSRQILTREVFTLYQAYLRDEAVTLPEAPKYRNYIGWLQYQEEAKAEAFWREELRGFTASTRLGLENPSRELEQSEASHGELTELLGPELTAKLDLLARGEQLTFNTIVQGAWALLLSRYSRHRDVVFGATVAGRSGEVAGIEDMVGLFINTLPVRVSCDDQEPITTYLKRLQARQAEVREYESSPLVKVQAWSEVKGKTLFDTLVVFENYPTDSVLRRQIGDSIQIDRLRLLDRSNYPLTLIAVPGDDLTLALHYSRKIWREADVASLFARLRVLLTEFANHPDHRLGQLALLSDSERRQITVEWNRNQSEFPRNVGVHQLFEQQAARSPQSIAVEYGSERLNYEDLNKRANQLAHRLLSAGVRPEDRVGICMKRGPEMVVAVLGILKAGAAYVPLDIEFPGERLKFMLEDARIGVLVRDGSVAEWAPHGRSGLLCIDIRKDWQGIEEQNSDNPGVGVDGKNLAYMMYTSGSTGVPKGILIPHEAITRLVRNTNYVQLGEQDRIAQVANTSFDATTFEIWGALLNGGCIVGIDQDTALVPGSLAEKLRAERISAMFLTSALFNQTVRQAPDAFASVGYVLVGGEAVDPQSVQTVLAHGKPGVLENAYGPTETTTFASWYRIEEVPQGAVAVPIGSGIGNTQLYVLDSNAEPVPVGIPGELYIGGPGLARGYLDRPELSAEKFVPDAVSGNAGERLYRTGDLVRWRSDGNLEFIGRLDSQVKVRGFRIEPGEVEGALKSLAAVQEAVVIVSDDELGDKRLVAYVVCGEGITIREMRQALKQRLPQYMLPSLFVKLDRFPLNENGKIDRKALPAPTTERRTEEESYAPPSNANEEILCSIWEKLLKVEQVGINDNFFEIGGDSIISIQVIARAREAGLLLTPRQVFEHPTIAELAQVAAKISVEHLQDAEDDGNRRAVPLTPIQAAFFEWKLEKPNHYNQAVLLDLKPGVDSAILEKTIYGLVRQHDALRLRYQAGERGWEQWCEPDVAGEIYRRQDLSALRGIDQRVAMERDVEQAHRGLDIEAGRLLNAVEYDLGPQKGRRLLLVIHHLVVDGVSWRILLQDLERAYQQLQQEGVASAWPKTTSFRRWAESLKRYSTSEQLHGELDYWSSAARRQVKPLPCDLEGENGNGHRQQTAAFFLDEEETRELLQHVPRAYHTQINDVLLTALGKVLAEWTGSEQVLLDMEGHGREEVIPGVDLSQTVGWFTAIYPVLLETPGPWDPGTALKRTKELLRKIPNRGFGYGALRFMHEDEQIRKRLADLPQAQISFNYLGQFDQVFRESRLFAPAEESSGRSVAPENRSQHLIDVGGIIARGRLQMNWTYDESLHRRESIERIGMRYMETLREIIRHCRSEEAGGYTPSDFPLSNIDEDDLGQIATLLRTGAKPS